ncbi:hypothetical protein [Vibrio owensii]|uniref:hypothetical protein n=1 Tax=Vibrio owensii TaxID=696485 RepID=UPI00215B8E70|nr:hypothetical protein [Vibrio owensii]MCR9943902.1 hypothetical protein [Vibrio owensii]
MISKVYRLEKFDLNALATHFKYWNKQKKGKGFSLERSLDVSNADSDVDIKNWFKLRAKNAPNQAFDDKCEQYIKSVMANVHNNYKSSKKWKNIDENGNVKTLSNRKITTIDEHTKQTITKNIPEIPVRFGHHRLDDSELALIREDAYNHYNTISDEFRVKHGIDTAEDYARYCVADFLTLYAKEFSKEFANYCKNEQTNKTKKHRTKTKIGDVQLLMNIHVSPDWKSGAHIHYIDFPFDPTTGLFLNPRNYVEAYRAVSIKLEKKYSKYLLQGVAQGLHKKEANDLKVDEVEKLKPRLGDQAESFYEERKAFVSSQLDELLSQRGMTFERLQEELLKRGLLIDKREVKNKTESKHFTSKHKDAEQIFTITDQQSGISFVNDSFTHNTRKILKKYAKNLITKQALEKTLPKDKNFRIDAVEKVIRDKYDRAMKKLNQNLVIGSEPTEELTKLKQQQFFEFFNNCLSVGIIVNINKQKHLTYHKIVENQKGNFDFKAIKYKSSIFADDDLQGKAIAEAFELDEESILELQANHIMNAFPNNRFMRYNVAHLNASSITNKILISTDKEAFLLTGIEKELERRNREIVSFNNKLIVLNKNTSEPTIQIFKKNDSTDIVEYNAFRPRDSALDALLIDKELLRNDPDIKSLSYKPESGKIDDFHRWLFVEVALNKDPNIRNKIEVEGFDSKTQEMLNERLDQMLDRAEQAIDKAANKPNQTKFNFTDTHLVYLLDSKHLDPASKKRIEEFLEKSVSKLRSKGIENITIDRKPVSAFIVEPETPQQPKRKPNNRQSQSLSI